MCRNTDYFLRLPASQRLAGKPGQLEGGRMHFRGVVPQVHLPELLLGRPLRRIEEVCVWILATHGESNNAATRGGGGVGC